MILRQQFNGFLNTPSLWLGDDIYGMSQHEMATFTQDVKSEFPPNLRLGKLVEQFVFDTFKKDCFCEMIAENIQIRKEKITIGELDCLVKIKKEFIHLEIVYKFYLFDPKLKNSALSPWIGPNRKDSLLQKLNKLKDQQLPLLFKEETLDTIQKLINKINLKVQNSNGIVKHLMHQKKTLLDFTNALAAGNVRQKVLFKGQLFLPHIMLNKSFSLINHACIVGFYISSSMLDALNENLFFIPEKRDWLIDPIHKTLWISHSEFLEKITTLMKVKRSPLCWLKTTNGNLQKFFVVWW
jgi:uncharacterized protein